LYIKSGRGRIVTVLTTWRPLADSDLPALAELAAACLAADGGQPFAASPAFLRQWYLDGAETLAGFEPDGGGLVCAASLRRRPGGGSAGAVTTGLVHPAWRHRGIGRHALGWASAAAGNDRMSAKTEALGAGAHALYLSRGLSQVLAEDVMQLPASGRLPSVPPPAGMTLSQWEQAGPARFHAVYAAAFRDRPGFPGWTQEQWVEWVSDDEDFRAQWALLATVGGTDAGFVVGDAGGWIVQMGVVPEARGQNIGASLIAEAVRRMRAAGLTGITLNVNVDNPHAAALYRRLAFTRIGRRAKYRALG
jgi:mycothiol synthase